MKKQYAIKIPYQGRFLSDDPTVILGKHQVILRLT